MDKYYYDEYWGTCREECNIKQDGTMIGSATCKECEKCMDYDHVEGYIICTDIDSAVGE